MKWKSDYESLHQLLEKVASGYSRYALDREKYTLDFEYKKIEPDKLIVKSARIAAAFTVGIESNGSDYGWWSLAAAPVSGGTRW